MKKILLLSFSMLVSSALLSRAQTLTVSTLAGNAGHVSTDGTGTSAQFNNPWGVAVDGSGNVYVADTDGHCIRKVTSGGVVTTVAGLSGVSGSTDNTGSNARFNSPQGIAVDGAGNLYVTDTGNHTIRKITTGGVVSTLAGAAGVSGISDGTGSNARFNNPIGIVISGSSLYVVDTWNHTIRAVVISSGAVTTFAGTAGTQGNVNANSTSAQFNLPQAIAVDGSGNFYVTDTGNELIRKISSGGAVTTFAGVSANVGTTDGATGSALFADPAGIAVDSANNVFVTDPMNNTIRKISSGNVSTPFGTAGVFGSADGTSSAASFWQPQGLAVDGSGNVYVADSGNGTIRKISGTAVTTLAGAPVLGSADGSGSAARFTFPSGACIDDNGNTYVADTFNHTIRSITPSGVVTTLAGSAGISGTSDGSGSSARFNSPQGIARDTSGNLYVADTANHAIRKITGNSVALFAGTPGTSGWSDATGSSALFNYPQDVAVDSSGNVYVADTWNHLIRKITSGGVVTTLAGVGQAYGDSDGTGDSVGTNTARFYAPGGLTVDSSGNVYVADTRNHTIRQITPGGVVSTIAGLGGSYGATDGTSNTARFFYPQSIAIDSTGNLFVLDSLNQTIRKLTVSAGVWTVTTAAGTAGVYGSADGTGTTAQFFNPVGLGINSSGVLAVADLGNSTIRQSGVAPVAATVNLSGLSQTYDASAKAATATTAPSGLSVTITYNGSTTPPTTAGSYAVVATINNSIYGGSANGTLIIAKASGTVTLGNLSQTYDGSAKSATATTSPSGLAVTFTYNGSATVPVNAGSYTVVGTINDANYQGSATNTLVIGKASGTVTLGNLSQTYDGSAKTATATTTPSGLTTTFTYDGSSTAPVNAGSYIVVGTINDANYQGSATNTLVVGKATAFVTLGNLSQSYDGNAKSASATTTPSGLTVNVTYNGSSTAPSAVGSYTVVGTVVNANYQGSATNTLVINKGSATVTLGNLSQTYDGTAKTATATTTPSGLTVAFTYNGSSTAPVNAGSYTVVGTINDANYQGSATNTLVIGKASGTVTLGNLSQTYNGSSKTATATTTPSGLSTTLTYNGSSTAPINAGSYTVVGSINDANYQGSATNTLVIAQASGTVTLGSLSQTYNGTARNATATTTPSGLTVVFTYNGLSIVPTNAGSYTVVGTISDVNYQGSATNTLVVDKAAATVSLGNLSQTYDGTAKSATATTAPVGLTTTFTYNASPNAPTNAGNYSVVGTISDANYQGSATNTLVIAKATATVTLGSLSQTYDGTGKTATATTTPSALAVTFTYNGSSFGPTNAGTYTVIGSVSDANYQGSATNNLVINKAAGTVTLGNLSQTYDGTAKSATATTSPSGLTTTLAYNASPSAPTNAGSYTVVGTISDANYQGSATNTLVVGKATATVTLGSLSQTYDGTGKSATATTTPSGLTLNFTYDGSPNAPTNAGSYTVVGTVVDANYQGAATNSLVIAKATATVTLVNLQKTYDGTAKIANVFTTPTGLTVSRTYNGLSFAPTNAGSYTVIATVVDANYQGSDTNTMVVHQATATVTLGNLSQTYDGSPKNASASTTPSGLTVNLTYDGSANAPTTVGSYTVIGTVSDVNYQGSATNTLVISKGTATVTLGSLSQTYDGSGKNATATTTPSSLTVTFTYDGSASAPINAGNYTVVGSINDANYQGSATNTLTIAKAQGSIALSDLSQTYDGTVKPITADTTPSGLTVSFVYSNAIYNSSNAPTNADSYLVIATINDSNYSGLATNTLTIAKATATVVLTDLTQTYDGTPKNATVTTTPAGLAFTITYDGSATPPVNVGSYNVVATVNDINYNGTTNGVLSINPGVGCPTVTLAPANLANAALGVAYNQTVTASGGSGPYTYSIAAGSLPSGLTLSSGGVLSGLPYLLQTNTFSIVAVDTNGCPGTAVYTIQIQGSGNTSDVNNPTVVISSPLNRKISTIANMTIAGTAHDTGTVRTGVAVVIYSLNGGPSNLVSTANKFTNWTVSATLQPGWNTFVAQSFDFRGNASTLASNIYFYGATTNVLGSYNGLFYETNNSGGPAIAEESAGLVGNLNVSSTAGAFGGRIYIAGANYPLKGRFDLAGNCSTNVDRGVEPLLLADLHLDWTGVGKQITGTISCPTEGWVAPLVADLAVYNSKNPHPVVRYTMVIPPANDAPTSSPAGYGYGSIGISAGGGVGVSGALADSTPISQSSRISKDGHWPFYCNLYKSQGLIAGWIDFSSGAPVGELTWIKPANPTGVTLTTYLNGFTNTVNAFGSVYTPVLPAIVPADQLLDITDGSGLNLPLTLGATINSLDAVTKLSGTNLLTGSVAKSSGIITVNFRPTGVNVTKTAKGVVLQTSNAAFGAFIGNNDGTGKTNTGAIHLH